MLSEKPINNSLAKFEKRDLSPDCYSDFEEEQKLELVRPVSRYYGPTTPVYTTEVSSVVTTPRLQTEDCFDTQYKLIDFWNHLHQAKAEGKGRLIMSALKRTMEPPFNDPEFYKNHTFQSLQLKDNTFNFDSLSCMGFLYCQAHCTLKAFILFQILYPHEPPLISKVDLKQSSWTMLLRAAIALDKAPRSQRDQFRLLLQVALPSTSLLSLQAPLFGSKKQLTREEWQDAVGASHRWLFTPTALTTKLLQL